MNSCCVGVGEARIVAHICNLGITEMEGVGTGGILRLAVCEVEERCWAWRNGTSTQAFQSVCTGWGSPATRGAGRAAWGWGVGRVALDTKVDEGMNSFRPSQHG